LYIDDHEEADLDVVAFVMRDLTGRRIESFGPLDQEIISGIMAT